MAGTMDILIREMTIADYDQVYGLWTEIKGFGIRSIDDSREGVERTFLGGIPTTSVVAVQNGHIIGNILCGHDGRTGCFYRPCAWRRDTGNTALDTAWCALPWRPFRKKESAKSA